MHLMGFLWTRDWSDAQPAISYLTFIKQTFMIRAGFEPAISKRGRPQSHSLDRAATGIGNYKTLELIID